MDVLESSLPTKVILKLAEESLRKERDCFAALFAMKTKARDYLAELDKAEARRSRSAV